MLDLAQLPISTARVCTVCDGARYRKNRGDSLSQTQCYNCGGTGFEPVPKPEQPMMAPKVDPNATPCPGCNGTGYRGGAVGGGTIDYYNPTATPQAMTMNSVQCSDCNGTGKMAAPIVGPSAEMEKPKPRPKMPYEVIPREFGSSGSRIVRLCKRYPEKAAINNGWGQILTPEEEAVWDYVQLLESAKDVMTLEAGVGVAKLQNEYDDAMVKLLAVKEGLELRLDEVEKQQADLASTLDRKKAEIQMLTKDRDALRAELALANELMSGSENAEISHDPATPKPQGEHDGHGGNSRKARKAGGQG